LTLREELPGAVYASLYTGRQLAEHGLHFPLQWSSARQRIISASSLLRRELEEHSIFRRLAAAGRSALVIDPSECPAHRVEGSRLVSGLQFRSRILLPEWSRPASARRRGAVRGPYLEETFGRPSPRFLRYLADELARAPERAAIATERLLSERIPDLLWVNLASIHLAGHQLWDLSQLDDSALSTEDRRCLEGSLAAVYRAADRAIARIVDRLPAGATILLLSPKGMGPNAGRADLLPQMVDRVLRRGIAAGRRRRAIWDVRAALPRSLRAGVARLLPSETALGITAWLHNRGIDPARARAFALPCDGSGFVRFSVRGREHDGCVAAHDVEGLAQELVDGLHSFEDMDGGPCVDRIVNRPEYAGEGPRTEDLPDLIVRWTSGSATRVRGVTSRRFGDVYRLGAGTGRSGNHGPGASLTLVPGRGATLAHAATECRVEDVPATVCALLGADASGLAGTSLLADGANR
jgi:hypothetical protein